MRSRLCVGKAIVFGLVMIMLSATATAKSADLVGKWAITGKLVTTSSDDPNAPKPGTVLTDNWTIAASDDAFTLTTPKGKAPGKATSDGAVFSTTFPFVSGVYITVTIQCVVKNTKAMYGTEEIIYTGTNCVTGEPMPLGREAWTFTGKKK